MRTIIILILISNIALGQKLSMADCNTIFICVDSVSYNNIFSNTFIRDTLFITKEKATQTTNETYTGKYAIGKAGNLEFFKPRENGKFGDRQDDFGIEFKTRNLGDLKILTEKVIKYRIAIDTSLTNITQQDSIIPWYRTLKAKNTKDNFEFSFLEYQKDYLEYLGFGEKEILSEMSFESFNEKISNGRKYPRQFNKISSVTIVLDKEEAKSIEAFCLLNNMAKKGNYYYNSDFKIILEVSSKPIKTKIKKITLKLLEQQKKSRSIKISDKVHFRIEKKECEIFFYK